MRLFTRFTTFAAVTMLMLGLATSASAQLVKGKDYRLIDPPQPTDSGKRVEILEFFWYGCPHCYALQPTLTAWLKHKPADVVFKHVPAVFQDSWVPLTKVFYTIDAMGLTDKLHQEVYTAIHQKRIQLQDPKVLFDWVASKGVDRQKFVATYNSFAVQAYTKRSIDFTRNYDIPGTPSLVVDGKYLAAPSLTLKADRTIDYDRFFRVLDQLIALARKNHVSK
jgi:thiol:disulfide interchange protein DsbA